MRFAARWPTTRDRDAPQSRERWPCLSTRCRQRACCARCGLPTSVPARARRGVSDTARLASDTGRKILALREQHRGQFLRNAYALILLDSLFERPYLDVRQAAAVMQCSFVKANKVVREMEAVGILQEITGNARNRVFRYQPYLALFEAQTGAMPSNDAAAPLGQNR